LKSYRFGKNKQTYTYPQTDTTEDSITLAMLSLRGWYNIALRKEDDPKEVQIYAVQAL